MNENEQRDHDERQQRCPAWPGFPHGWVNRSSCDRCGGPLSVIASNLAVPLGTPIVCGPCTHEGPPQRP